MKKLFSGIIILSLMLISLPGYCQQVRSTFDSDLDSWKIGDMPGYGQPPYDPPMGTFIPKIDFNYISQTDPTGYVWYWQAPSKFLGDQSGAYGKTLSFRAKQIVANGSTFNEADIVLVGGGLVLVKDLSPFPATDWTSYSIKLDTTGGWKKNNLNGSAPTQSEIMSVLSSLTALRIRGEYISGNDSSGLTLVVLESTITISSSFDKDADGWVVVDLPYTNSGPYDPIVGSPMNPTFNQGGNPGGFAVMEDPTGNMWHWMAPAKFLGYKANLYGQSLKFDRRQVSYLNDPGEPIDYGTDVLMVGTNGITLCYPDTGANPGFQWKTCTVPLKEGGWRKGSPNGSVATQEEFQSVLSSIKALYVCGEFINGTDTSALDNVIMGDEYVEITNPIPQAKREPDGTPVIIKGAVITASFDGFSYIQSTTTHAGIRVDKAGDLFDWNTMVNVTGFVRTNDQGERFIDATDIDPDGSGSIEPLGLANSTLGGGPFGVPPLGQTGIEGASGLNNIGLLVTIWGKVLETEQVTPPATPSWCIIDDGSAVGIKCVLPIGSTVASPGYAVVTGISSCEKIDGKVRRLLRIRCVGDIVSY